MKYVLGLFKRKRVTNIPAENRCFVCNTVINGDEFCCSRCIQTHRDNIMKYSNDKLVMLKSNLSEYIVEVKEEVNEYYNYEIVFKSNHIQFVIAIGEEIDIRFTNYNSPNHSHLSVFYDTDEKIVSYLIDVLDGKYLFYDVKNHSDIWKMSSQILFSTTNLKNNEDLQAIFRYIVKAHKITNGIIYVYGNINYKCKSYDIDSVKVITNF